MTKPLDSVPGELLPESSRPRLLFEDEHKERARGQQK